MRHRIIIFVLPVFLFLSMVIPHSLFSGEPGKLIMDAVERGLSIREEYSLDKPEERRKCEQRIWAELSPIFDFEEMSKRALGLYWKKRSPDEKKESNYASVQTKIITHTGAEVVADYRLFKNEGNRINDVSIDKGESYENITKPAVDPYIAIQDAYIQNRMKKIKE